MKYMSIFKHFGQKTERSVSVQKSMPLKFLLEFDEETIDSFHDRFLRLIYRNLTREVQDDLTLLAKPEKLLSFTLWENVMRQMGPEAVLRLIAQGFTDYPETMFNYCVRSRPDLVLQYLADRLSRDVLLDCARRASRSALLHIPKMLPPDMLAEFAYEHPRLALLRATPYLSRDTLRECIRQLPEIALNYMRHHLDPELLGEALAALARDHPEKVIRYAAEYYGKG